MSPATITLIVVAVLLIGVIVALYFLGKKAQKRQAEQELVRGFTPEETVELRRLLHKLLDNVSGNNPDTIPSKTIRTNQTQKEEQL